MIQTFITKISTSSDLFEISLKETQRNHGEKKEFNGVALPMTIEEYEKELELINKSKKKTTKLPDNSESSTSNDGIFSTWLQISSSNMSTSKPTQLQNFAKRNNSRIEIVKTTRKRLTTTLTPKIKFSKPIKNTTISVESTTKLLTTPTTKTTTTTIKPTTVKVRTSKTTKKRATAVRTKPTTTPITTTTIASTTEISTASEETTVPEPTTFLILEPKDADFALPDDRKDRKPTKNKSTSTSNKKKKKGASKKKPSDQSLAATKNPEKPLTELVYNFLSRQVMPAAGVGLVGLVVTAGLATYFLGSPLTALRRNIEISNRKDDNIYDRIDDGMPEEEMFSRVISGMPENQYKNNIRMQTYRPYASHPGNLHNNNKYRKVGYRDAYPQYSMYHMQNQANQAKQFSLQQRPTTEKINVDLIELTTPIIQTEASLNEFQSTQNIIVDQSDDEYQNSIANNILNKRTQIVDTEESELQPSASPLVQIVPEHGPRRKKRSDVEIIDAENEIKENTQKEKDKESTTEANSDRKESTTSTSTIEMAAKDDGLVHFIRQAIELKLKMFIGVVDSFQRYLKGVEERFRQSQIFNPSFEKNKKPIKREN